MTKIYESDDNDESTKTVFDDEEFNPTLEPKKAKAWLNLLQESEDAFDDYNNPLRQHRPAYANLSALSNMNRDKEFQMFWANCRGDQAVDLRQAARSRWWCRSSWTAGRSTRRRPSSWSAARWSRSTSPASTSS
jgi:hypothetical protein